MHKKMNEATQIYDESGSCGKAILCAYADEIGIPKEVAARMMDGFDGGYGDCGEMCSALSAITMILSCKCCKGDEKSRHETCGKIKQAMEMFEKEYGGIKCKDILKGGDPEQASCRMKVKDSLLILDILMPKEDEQDE